MIFVLIPLYLLFTVAGLMLIKVEGKFFKLFTENGMINMSISWKLILGFISYVISFILWTILLQKNDLTILYPVLTGLAYICILIASIFVLKETFTPVKLIGVITILIGIILINIGKGGAI